jgi:hypothetical protein
VYARRGSHGEEGVGDQVEKIEKIIGSVKILHVLLDSMNPLNLLFMGLTDC